MNFLFQKFVSNVLFCFFWGGGLTVWCRTWSDGSIWDGKTYQEI